MDFVYPYNINAFPFHSIVQRIFGCDNLLFLHQQLIPQGGEVPDYDFQPGKDQSSVFHKRFYEAIKADPEFLTLYRRFVRDVVYHGGHNLGFKAGWNHGERMFHQKIPTFRVHLPNNKAVGGKSHKDADYNHPLGEINFLVPLTPMRGTSGVFYETSPGTKDFRFKELDPGQFWVFDGNQCEHGNMPNSMGWTRVSFDFRVISEKNLMLAQDACSVAYGLKFAEGEYYEAL